MRFEVVWSHFAEYQVDNIYLYYIEQGGYNLAGRIVETLLNESKRLAENPFIGQIEENTRGRKIVYRYLVVNNFKIIYSFDKHESMVKIADVFDTRQNPTKIQRNT